MAFPTPSEKQAKVLWFSVTALAIAVCVALIGLLLSGVGWMLDRLSPVLLPMAVAGIIAYLLNPVVNFFEHRVSERTLLFESQNRTKVKRLKAIIYVFTLAVGLVSLLLVSVVPKVGKELALVVENSGELREKFSNVIDTIDQWGEKLMSVFSKDDNGDQNATDVNASNAVESPVDTNATQAGPGPPDVVDKVSDKVSAQLMVWAEAAASKAVGWFGILVGMMLVPVYVFYFLLEARSIEGRWTDYLPLMESKFKEEVVYVLNEFNNCLIVFFRCQVLVAICVGTLLALGFWIIGLPHGILLGLLAGLVGIIPYFGVIISTIPVLALSMAYPERILGAGDNTALAPVIALAVCAGVLLLEKTVIQPKIVGDRVGMHPVAVIISVLLGTALVGGIIGGLLAIPIVMAGRTLLFRYVWKGRKRKGDPEKTDEAEPKPEPA